MVHTPLKHFPNVDLTAPFSGLVSTIIEYVKSGGSGEILYVFSGCTSSGDNGILDFIVREVRVQSTIVRNVNFAFVKISHLFKDQYCYRWA